MSGEYEMPTNPAWLPYQKLRMYDLPSSIIEQANQTVGGLQMGVMLGLGHCWAVMDNCLYLWDYTVHNPDWIGYEDNPHPITAVNLIKRKSWVFVTEITHLMVVATSDTMLLLGLSTQTTQTGAKTVALYNTSMWIHNKGLNVRQIEASNKTGRIWMPAVRTFTNSNTSKKRAGSKKRLLPLVLDDTRNLMYTLSDTSEIKVWLVKEQVKLDLFRALSILLQNLGHFTGPTDRLYGRDVRIIELSVITATEGGKLNVMGHNEHRLQNVSVSNARLQQFCRCTESAEQHESPACALPAERSKCGSVATAAAVWLDRHDTVQRASAGQHRDIIKGDHLRTAPTDYRLATSWLFNRRTRSNHGENASGFVEFGQWIYLPSGHSTVALVTPDFAATSTPVGFGNEMAAQFDRPSAEIAIMVADGVPSIRRRRLVGVFASMMRYASMDEEGHEGDMKRFVRTYGRSETVATALAVACGQGMDVTSESRVTAITDPDVVEATRKASSTIEASRSTMPTPSWIGTRSPSIACDRARGMRVWHLQLINSNGEGIPFVLVPFDERLEDILAVLREESRRKGRDLTFEQLFISAPGSELAKELVKAMVNRNIANGSNVDSVAEALRVVL
ncbi:hypothetical protein LTR35_017582 [Friedmanniomyces endolithicus]|nr:hypothetical protein LTR35_017582 [Friedmanniomyces endolithicus]KAK0972382.1 hypothetical protein LTR54_017581 [Friedmanniomyces endolithicus]